MELEDGPALGRLDRVVEVDPVDDADELAPNGMPRATGPRTSRKNATRSAWSSSVAVTSSALRRTVMVAPPAARRLRTQLTSPHGAQTQRLPDDVDDRDRRRAGQAARPAADGDEAVEAQRDAGGQRGAWRPG